MLGTKRRKQRLNWNNDITKKGENRITKTTGDNKIKARRQPGIALKRSVEDGDPYLKKRHIE